jgi:hypothetical protein
VSCHYKGSTALDLNKHSLSDLINLLATQPTVEARNAFYRRLLQAKVGFILPKASINNPVAVPPLADSNDALGIPVSIAGDGTPLLLLYCDIPKLVQLWPSLSFVELDAIVALEMARNIQGGIIVRTSLDPTSAFAGVPSHHIEDVLANRF